MDMQSRNHSPISQFMRGFVAHPASVDETYLQHAGFALRFAATLFLAACAAFIHAILPPVFETTAGRIIQSLHKQIENRHAGNNS